MDGDRRRWRSWPSSRSGYGAHVIVDEAHATGCFGPTGSGLRGCSRAADARAGDRAHRRQGARRARGVRRAARRLLQGVPRQPLPAPDLHDGPAAARSARGGSTRSRSVQADDAGRAAAARERRTASARTWRERGIARRRRDYIVPIVLGDDARGRRGGAALAGSRLRHPRDPPADACRRAPRGCASRSTPTTTPTLLRSPSSPTPSPAGAARHERLRRPRHRHRRGQDRRSRCCGSAAFADRVRVLEAGRDRRLRHARRVAGWCRPPSSIRRCQRFAEPVAPPLAARARATRRCRPPRSLAAVPTPTASRSAHRNVRRPVLAAQRDELQIELHPRARRCRPSWSRSSALGAVGRTLQCLAGAEADGVRAAAVVLLGPTDAVCDGADPPAPARHRR